MPAERAGEKKRLPLAGPHVLAWIGCGCVARWWPWDHPCAMPHCNRFLREPRQIGWHATGRVEQAAAELDRRSHQGRRWTKVRRRCALLGLAFRPTIAAEEYKEMT